MVLFLDTEWADLKGTQLVSLALVSENREHSFYAERDPLPAKPTPFAQTVVYPLLDRGRFAVRDAAFTTRLRAFLCSIPQPNVIYDHPNDAVLLRWALFGFNMVRRDADACGPVPHVAAVLDNSSPVSQAIEQWFAKHLSAKRHHALVDANALRAGWLSING